MKRIYLDNSATTPPFKEVIALMAEIQERSYANPSSLHEMGLEAEKHIIRARRQVASAIGAAPKEIIFTSGGTESNNLALKGAARRARRRGAHLVTTAVEHSSVLKSLKDLETEGFKVSVLPVDSKGLLDPARLEAALTEETVLVSINHVSNETGAIQPLEGLGPRVKAACAKALFHVDAVQSLGKLPLELISWRADLISVSAHKIHGPKGTGALWVRSGVLIDPLFSGGDQEKGLRPGTENLAGIAAFGLAAELAAKKAEPEPGRIGLLKNLFFTLLKGALPEIVLNGPSLDKGAPHILSISFPGVRAQALLNALSAEGIYVAAGSACHSRRPEPSHVLLALGLERKLIEGALRFSFSLLNSENEMRRAASIIDRTYKELKGL